MDAATLLPIIFAGLMAVAVFFYIIFDGYDLGVGLLFPFVKERADRDAMVATIDPFWDANETWIVLGVGVLFIAFPQAYGDILVTLYIPTATMLGGLILRGCAFDFRNTAKIENGKIVEDVVDTDTSYFIVAKYGDLEERQERFLYAPRPHSPGELELLNKKVELLASENEAKDDLLQEIILQMYQ